MLRHCAPRQRIRRYEDTVKGSDVIRSCATEQNHTLATHKHAPPDVGAQCAAIGLRERCAARIPSAVTRHCQSPVAWRSYGLNSKHLLLTRVAVRTVSATLSEQA